MESVLEGKEIGDQEDVEKFSDMSKMGGQKTGSGDNNNVKSRVNDSFLYETKYVVLNFMKMLPKDVNERSWTPVSSGSDREQSSESSHRITPIFEQGRLASSGDETNCVTKDHGRDTTSDPLKARRRTLARMHSAAEKKKTTKTALKEDLSDNAEVSNFACKPNTSIEIDLADDSNNTNNIDADSKDTRFRNENEIPTGSSTKSQELFSCSTSANSSHGDGSCYSDADDELDASSSSGHQSGRSSSDTKLIILDPAHTHHGPGVVDTWTSQAQSNRANDTSSKFRRAMTNQHQYFGNKISDVEHEQIDSRQLASGSDDSFDMPDDSTDPMSSSSTSLRMSSVSGKDSADMQNDRQQTKLSSTSTTNTITGLEARKPPNRSLLTLDINCEQLHNEQGSRHPKLSDSMTSEILRSLNSLESEVEEAIRHHTITPSQSPFAAPLTPETEAARKLAEIACQVEGMYRERLENAVREVLTTADVDNITYDMFRSAASSVIDETVTGWTRVALLLMYSQRLLFAMVQSGHRGLNYLVDNAACLVADKAADFIFSQGGWGSVAQTKISSSSCSQWASGETSQDNSPEKGLTHSVSEIQSAEIHPTTNNLDIPMAASSTPVEHLDSRQFEGTRLQAGLNRGDSSLPDRPASGDSESGSVTSSSSPEGGNISENQVGHGTPKPRMDSTSFISAEIVRRAHDFGFSFPIAAAVILVGIAIVLSKH